MSRQFSTFPGQNSIIPVCFYTRQGLPSWLNQNRSYKRFFVNYPNLFPGLSTMTSTLSTMDYNIENVPLSPLITTLSQYEAQKNDEQFRLFTRVYEFNSNAFVTSDTPLYYRFSSFQELTTYKASVGMINKMYPFDAMLNGTDENGETLGWIVPFPLAC
jgi:hypothetical protein